MCARRKRRPPHRQRIGAARAGPWRRTAGAKPNAGGQLGK